jgi:hypothetical protein
MAVRFIEDAMTDVHEKKKKVGTLNVLNETINEGPLIT